MRNFAERATRFKPLQTFIYWSEFLMVTTILDAPLGLYEGYFRERQYGLATQTLLPWLGDQLIGYGRIIPPSRIKKRLTSVQPEEVRRVARAFFRPERLSLAIVSPLKNSSSLSRLVRL